MEGRTARDSGAQEGKEGREAAEQLGCQEMKTSDACVGVSVWASVLPAANKPQIYTPFCIVYFILGAYCAALDLCLDQAFSK